MTQIKPIDIISGVETLKDTAAIQKWLDFEEEKDVVSSKTYLEWTQDGYDEGNLSSCVGPQSLDTLLSYTDNSLMGSRSMGVSRDGARGM